MLNRVKNLQPMQGASCADVQSTKQTESILNLSNREIAIRLQSLSLDDLEKLAPLLRVLMYVVLTRESHATEEHSANSNLWSGDGLY